MRYQSQRHSYTILFWTIIVFAAILDISLANLGNLISTNFSAWKIQLYLAIAIVLIAGQLYVLYFIKQKKPARGGRTSFGFNTLFKIVSGVQYTLTVTQIIVIIQMLLASYYSVAILIVNIILSYVLAITMMLILAQRFFSWFKSRRNSVILLFGVASITIGIELILTVIITMALFESINRTIGSADLLGMTPVFPPSTAFIINEINSFYIAFSITSFAIMWIATALLLRQYSTKTGRIRYWGMVSLPLLYFLFQFVSFILNVYVPFIAENTISYSILVTLIFTLSKPVGGILFGVAFWNISKHLRKNDKVVKQYLTVSGYGLLMLFISDQAITLTSIAYPPFGLATISFLGTSSVMMLIGIYSSAISVAEDSQLRRSIRDMAVGHPGLLDSIGSAEMEREMEDRVLTFTRQFRDTLEEETGVESSITEDETKHYLEQVITELKKQKTTGENAHFRDHDNS